MDISSTELGSLIRERYQELWTLIVAESEPPVIRYEQVLVDGDERHVRFMSPDALYQSDAPAPIKERAKELDAPR